MRRKAGAVLALGVIASLSFSNVALATDKAEIDPTLRECISVQLGRGQYGTVTAEDLGKITELKCATLADLDKLENLTSFEFEPHRMNPPGISGKFASLAKLKKLKKLSLRDAGVKNLSFLSSMTQLEELNLNSYDTAIEKYGQIFSNEIRDITPLAPLTNLKVLKVNNALLRDISTVKKMPKLEELDLGHVRGVSKEDSSYKLRDISALAGLTNLRKLNIEHNAVADLSPLKGLKKLGYVNFNNNRVIDMAPVCHVSDIAAREQVASMTVKMGKLVPPSDCSGPLDIDKQNDYHSLPHEFKTEGEVDTFAFSSGKSGQSGFNVKVTYTVSQTKPADPAPETSEWQNLDSGTDCTARKGKKSRTKTTYTWVDDATGTGWVLKAVTDVETAQRDLNEKDLKACAGPKPADEVTTTDWEDIPGTLSMDFYNIEQQRTKTTISYKWDAAKATWVKGEPQVEVEKRERPLTEQEIRDNTPKPAGEYKHEIKKKRKEEKDCRTKTVTLTHTFITAPWKWSLSSHKWVPDYDNERRVVETDKPRPMSEAELKECPADAPEPKKNEGPWLVVVGSFDAKTKTLEESRLVTTIPYKWDAGTKQYVLDEANKTNVTENRRRDCTNDELKDLLQKPEAKVVKADWVEGDKDCKAKTVKRTREVETSQPTWDAAKRDWSFGPAQVSVEEGTRDMTEAEIKACSVTPPAPGPGTDAGTQTDPAKPGTDAGTQTDKPAGTDKPGADKPDTDAARPGTGAGTQTDPAKPGVDAGTQTDKPADKPGVDAGTQTDKPSTDAGTDSDKPDTDAAKPGTGADKPGNDTGKPAGKPAPAKPSTKSATAGPAGRAKAETLAATGTSVLALLAASTLLGAGGAIMVGRKVKNQ
ncbi:hypothetical protein QP400_09565 [Winkia sp. UMB3158]|uniref:hypothetical protein n=1 Tax=Winkia TaxID=2692118 RepID=UPI00065F8D45|nr:MULTISPECIES: hypothetical protein [Winkia]MDK8341404.1 hypothetical protein [Winkia sp. UMB3164B]PMC93196.1 hypothetical protein CJ188_05295 [Actinomyces sp. UMB0918]MBS5948600.1 hypothetical protein [Winkia neuii]MCG7302045.1 hypothetical protein [Winkia sp. ACRQY]MDK7150367.1 hypothetical protein [Winkia sp. UMB3158]